MSTLPAESRLAWRDYVLIGTFCVLLFGWSLVSGRPLSLHEAVLPQSAREMLADGDWVVPKKGQTPWLESPPLPQWITVSVASVVGRCDEVWIVRLPAVMAATATVLLVGWMASVWYGRTIALLAGFVMATTCQFTRYAWLAEDEIFLCLVITACIAAFVRLEFATTRIDRDRGWLSWLVANRPWPVWLFFISVGATNLVKGLLFGMVMAGVPMFLFLVFSNDWKRLEKYVWVWGPVLAAAIALAWPYASYVRYPDVVEVWRYDLGGRLDGSYVSMAEPIWYYPAAFIWMLLPWTFVIPTGMWVTRTQFWRQATSAERFLWCWAIGVPLVFSIPHGKHHHYMLSALAPWSILGTIGLIRARAWMMSWPQRMRNPFNSLVTTALPIAIVIWVLRDKIPGPDSLPIALIAIMPVLTVGLSWGLLHRNPRLAAGILFASLTAFFCTGHVIAGRYIDRHRQDVAFLQRIQSEYRPDQTLLVDMNIDPLVGFLHLFYLDDQVVPLHNLSFAVDAGIDDDRVLVLTRSSRLEDLQELGIVREIDRGWKTDKRGNPEPDQLALFELSYGLEIPRVERTAARVSPMQAMLREPGPDLRRQ